MISDVPSMMSSLPMRRLNMPVSSSPSFHFCSVVAGLLVSSEVSCSLFYRYLYIISRFHLQFNNNYHRFEKNVKRLQDNLDKDMNKQFNKFKIQNQTKLNELKKIEDANILTALKSAKDIYLSSMSSFTDNVKPFTPDELENLHIQACAQAESDVRTLFYLNCF